MRRSRHSKVNAKRFLTDHINYLSFYFTLSLMGDSTMGGLLPHFFCFQFFSYFHLFSTKNLSKVLRFFLLLTFSGKTGQNFSPKVLKLAFQKCGRRPPIVLLLEIDKPKKFKLNFSRSFLHIIVEIGEKYTLNPFFNILEVQLASKNRKLKSAVVDPHIVLSPSSKRDFQIAIFS